MTKSLSREKTQRTQLVILAALPTGIEVVQADIDQTCRFNSNKEAKCHSLSTWNVKQIVIQDTFVVIK